MARYVISGRFPTRRRIPFRSVNCRDAAGFDPDLQRHHLLPLQLQSRRCFFRLFDRIGPEGVVFDDFRSNGLLLPSQEQAALRTGLPLHRGPHRSYNQMVMERVGLVEVDWAAEHGKSPTAALAQALFRLALLQRALRRRLLDPRGRRYALSSKDPHGRALDFSHLDAMADFLWGETTS